VSVSVRGDRREIVLRTKRAALTKQKDRGAGNFDARGRRGALATTKKQRRAIKDDE